MLKDSVVPERYRKPKSAFLINIRPENSTQTTLNDFIHVIYRRLSRFICANNLIPED